MTRPLASVVRVASTPEQAKVFVALLQAEGIPAYVDGDSLTDEVALSRRLMNLNGVRVMVPSGSVEQARELLHTVEIDPVELEQQALTAQEPVLSAPSALAAPSPAPKRRIWPLVTALALAALFLALWLDEVDKRTGVDPLFDWVVEDAALRQVRLADGNTVALFHDANHDRIFERVEHFDPRGALASTQFDEDRNGVFERAVIRRNGWTETWTDDDRDGCLDSCAVADAQGMVVQRVVWRDGAGFVIEKP